MNRMLVAGTLAVAVALLAGIKGNGENLLQRLREQGVGTTPKPLDPIEFELQDLEGKSIKLSSLKGKAVFLNFWATWCGPCRTEMPSMQRLYERFKDQGLEILAVDLQEDKARVQSFVKELGLTFKVLLDTKGTVGAQYAARAIPTTYLLDRKGFVFARMAWPPGGMLCFRGSRNRLEQGPSHREQRGDLLDRVLVAIGSKLVQEGEIKQSRTVAPQTSTRA